MTKLEAVNSMLMSIGLYPVNTLTDTGIPEVDVAVARLDEVTRRVQTIGWAFNTDYDFELQPDVNGNIPIPYDALRVDVEDRTKDIVMRQGKLYDRVNQTFLFSEPIKATIIRSVAFDDCPPVFQDYVAYRAARLFVATMRGSDEADQFTVEEERRLLAELRAAENDDNEINLFTSGGTYLSPDMLLR